MGKKKNPKHYLRLPNISQWFSPEKKVYFNTKISRKNNLKRRGLSKKQWLALLNGHFMNRICIKILNAEKLLLNFLNHPIALHALLYRLEVCFLGGVDSKVL